jgi:hypothetical protein
MTQESLRIAITIQIAGGEQVSGEDFWAQIGDGGTFDGGSESKPAFSNVEIIGGTIFAANSTGAYGNPTVGNAAHPFFWHDATVTARGSVSAAGIFGVDDQRCRKLDRP